MDQQRKYREAVNLLADGVKACWKQSLALLAEANSVRARGSHSLALSLAVLAMEEVGKLMLTDGLLFAKHGDQRSQSFDKGFRDHKAKLAALDTFPFFVQYLGTLDPRLKTEDKFGIALTITVKSYQRERQFLWRWIGPECDLTRLDIWKQKGFYTHYANGQFTTPNDAIAEEFADGVIKLATRFVTTIDFLLKNNISRYRSFAANVRQALTEEQHSELIREAESLVAGIFAEAQSPESSTD